MAKTSLFDRLFPKSYILTIRDYRARHARLKNILEKAEIPNAEFHFGKKHVSKSIFKNPASRGITETHLELHRIAQKKRDSNVIIFEDDISIAEDFKTNIHPILVDLQNQDWDIFYFFKPIKGNPSDDYGTRRGEIVETFESGLVKTIGTLNAHAMALNINNIDKIRAAYNLEFIKTLPLQIRVVDKSIAASGLNMYACDQDFIYQSNEFHSSTLYAGSHASLFKNIALFFNPAGKKRIKSQEN